MKKSVVTSLLLIFVLVLLGYTWQNNNRQSKNNEISKKNRVFDFEKPEEKADISGIVKTITGNEVTVLKIERQTFDENSNENRDIEKDKSDNVAERRPASGMGGGMGMGSRLNVGDENSDERLEMLKSLSTEDEKIIIPVGIKMLKNDNGKMIEATLDDVTKDKMLTIWIDENITDKNIAYFVVIK